MILGCVLLQKNAGMNVRSRWLCNGNDEVKGWTTRSSQVVPPGNGQGDDGGK